MADAKKMKARVLVNGAHGKVDDVIEIDEKQAKSLVGVLDTSPEAVEYAESLPKKEQA